MSIVLISGPVSAILAYSDSDWDPVYYKGNFFVILEPSGPFELEEYDEDKTLKQILEEARYIFSAIIYGFEFEYIPMDSSRGIAEEFSLEPIHTLPWGDPGLSISAGKYDDGRYTAEIRYDVSEQQLPWVESWDTNVLPDVTAAGLGSLYQGFDGKIKAVDNSVKESIRAYLRPRIYDKPQKVTGRARLSSVPYIIVNEGLFRCTSRVTLQVEDLREYRAY